MRVLLAPEVYSAADRLEMVQQVCDMRNWVVDWLDRDPSLHVYWLVPKQRHIDYDEAFLCADRDRVTLLTDRRFGQGKKYKKVESWREQQLETIKREVDTHYAYFDAAIVQHAGSQDLLWRFLNDLFDETYASVAPFHLVRHLYMFKSPWRKHTRYRNDTETIIDLATLACSDEVWRKNDHDQPEVNQYGREYLSFDALNDIDDRTIDVATPIECDAYDPAFSDEPTRLQINNTANMDSDVLDAYLGIAERVYARHDIPTQITPWSDDPTEYDRDGEFLTVREVDTMTEYRDAMADADIALSGTIENVSGLRQLQLVAAGQVLVTLQRPWTAHHLPDDYPLTAGSPDEAEKLVHWALANWDAAVDHGQRLQTHLTETRDVGVIGEQTHARLQTLVDDRVDSYGLSWDEEVIADTLAYLDRDPVPLDTLDETTKRFTDSGSKLCSLFGYTRVDLVAALRTMGYRDTGARTPAFTEVA